MKNFDKVKNLTQNQAHFISFKFELDASVEVKWNFSGMKHSSPSLRKKAHKKGYINYWKLTLRPSKISIFRFSLTWITLAQKIRLRSENARMDGGLFFIGASRLAFAALCQ